MHIARVSVSGRILWAELAAEQVYQLEGNRFERPQRGALLGSLDAIRLLAPIESHNKIFALLGNFMGRGARKGPGFFSKPISAVIAHGEPIVRPPDISIFNLEAEIGVVIGQRTKHVPAARAMEHVLGYTVVNDVTSFPIMEEDGQLSTRWKSYDTFCPLGPAIVCPPPDVAQLTLTSRVNGELKQNVSLATMDFGVAETVAWISAVVTLEPGDVISMGTPPGFANIAPGDLVECAIDGIGVLRNPVVAHAE